MIHEQYEAEEKLKEECGVFGMYDFDGGDVASAPGCGKEKKNFIKEERTYDS